MCDAYCIVFDFIKYCILNHCDFDVFTAALISIYIMTTYVCVRFIVICDNEFTGKDKSKIDLLFFILHLILTRLSVLLFTFSILFKHKKKILNLSSVFINYGII
jgi:hypothetical protein